MNQTAQTIQLANGMDLVVLEQHDVAVATADVWVRTGSADEPKTLSGVSHFLEHMLFKGTQKYGLGEIERRIERSGGQSNAGTSYDFTHYYVTLPSAGTATAIDMLAEMVRNSVVDQIELEKERKVILEEYRRKQDLPTGVLFERLYAEVFAAGRYHDPVIGYEETIKSITREEMLDYYRRRYAPENMTLVVTGDVTTAEAQEAAEAAFAGFARPSEQLQPTPGVKLGAGVRLHAEKPTGGELYAAFAWGGAGFESASAQEILALDTAQFILGQGRAARLYQSIKEKQGLCSSITAFYSTHAGGSMFGAFVTCTPQQLPALREGLLQEVKIWLRGPIEAEELQRAKRLLASAHRFGMETSSGAAGQLGYYKTLTGSTDFLEQYEAGISKLSGEQIQEAVQRALPPEKLAENIVEVAVGPNLSS